MERDLIVNDGEFAYVQDGTNGLIQSIVGPLVFTPSQSDVPVLFDWRNKQFVPCSREQANQKIIVAKEGEYIVLFNPANDEDKQSAHPPAGKTKLAKTLSDGSKIVIPGPAKFPLWPRQFAEVIPGHDLKSNQYLLTRVYNASEANKEVGEAAQGLITGDLLVIKGTEVSFYIPPTGIEVVKDESGKYNRDALTLEALEYCILRDESGEKRYEKGPSVVFPKPTETFVEVKDDKGNGHKKARAIELNELQGIHLKVIRDYTEIPDRDYEETIPDGKGTKIQRKAGEKIERKAGEELFVTGKQTTIFYPSEELAFVKYDGRTKTFATTVPEGEGRYQLNRVNGKIETIKGPTMLLPDPRTHVIVRRALTDDQVVLWFPKNNEALAYNRSLQSAMAAAPTTRAGTLSEGDVERNVKGMKSRRMVEDSLVSTASVMNYASTMSAGESSRVSGDQKGVGDEFSRSSGYTAPRSIQLDTKYQGAVMVKVWTGYAILVVNQTGDRRVVKGPTTVLLNYDETLEYMALSTGKPKNTDQLLRTVYLRVDNNKVADIVEVETSDHVKVQVKTSYLVNFTGSPDKWFSAENYVKLLCDRARSVLKSAVHKITLGEFYDNAADITRDILLGKKDEGRVGLLFPENNMHMVDLEVLGTQIMHPDIAAIVDSSFQSTIKVSYEVAALQRNFDLQSKKEVLVRENLKLGSETQDLKYSLEMTKQANDIALSLAKISNAIKELDETKKKEEAHQNVLDLIASAELYRTRAESNQALDMRSKEQALDLERTVAETTAAVERFNAAKGDFATILATLADKQLVEKIAESTNINRLIFDQDVVGQLLQQIAGVKGLEGIAARLLGTKNGSNGAALVAPSKSAAS